MNDDTVIDAELVPAEHATETHVLTLRELPRHDEPMLPIPAGGWSTLDKAMAFHQLQEAENARSGRPFDWFDWLRSLLAAQGRKDVDGFRDLIAIGEKRGFFA